MISRCFFYLFFEGESDESDMSDESDWSDRSDERVSVEKGVLILLFRRGNCVVWSHRR